MIPKKNSDTNHYSKTPYNYDINILKRLALDDYIDLNEGLIECLKRANNE